MAKSNRKKQLKEGKATKSFLESNSIRTYTFWAVITIMSLIAVMSAFVIGRNAISRLSPKLGKRPLSKQMTMERQSGEIKSPRIFKRSPPNAIDNSCNCTYDSPVTTISDTYEYKIYPNTNTNWSCAFTCCEQSPTGVASLAKLKDIEKIQQLHNSMNISLTPWIAMYCVTPDDCSWYDQPGHSQPPTLSLSNLCPRCHWTLRCFTSKFPTPVTITSIPSFYCSPDLKLPPLCQMKLTERSTSRHVTSGSNGNVTSNLQLTSLKTGSVSNYSAPNTNIRPISTDQPSSSNTHLLECTNALCMSQTTMGCSLDGHRCICMSGWEGIACHRPIDHCSDYQCRFGHCINHNDTYQCTCLNGYAGEKCEIAIGGSTAPIQVYNAFVQRLGTIWVLISTVFSFIVLTALRDISPIACLSRHSLVALFCEHLLITFFQSPAVLNVNQAICHWMSLVMLYFRGVHMLLTFFLANHIHYIMTGVTSGQWGWNGDWRIFESLAWGSPVLVCVAIWAVSFADLGTGFTCMMNWETHGVRWFLIMLPSMLLSLSSLEQAHSEMHLQKKCTSSIVDIIELRVAHVTLWGMYFLIILAPISYVACSYAVFTGSPFYFSFGCGCNIALGTNLLLTFVITNQYAWCLIVKWFRAMRNRVVREKEEPNDMENVERPESRFEQRMIGRVRYTWS